MDRLTVEITNPFIRQVIRGLVESGEYASAEDVVNDGVFRLTEVDLETLSEEDRAAIAEADAQIERGEVIEFSEFARRIREKYGIPK